MSETPISVRDTQKVWDKPTDERHRFKLETHYCYVLEVRDVHFNHDSAVLLPDKATDAGGADSEDSRITGLSVIWGAYEQVQEHPEQKILVIGHTDRSGPAAYNQTLSERRSENVFAVLTGNRTKWVQGSSAKHKVEDYQLILKWANDLRGWNCDPGPITNKDNPETKNATEQFQKNYNKDFKQSITEDGIVGNQTWGAFFDLYMDTLHKLMETDAQGLQAIQQSLQFVDPQKKTVGCGERFPIEEPLLDDYKSVTNRRVEILFFDPGEEPELDCHPAKGQCLFKKCEIYNERVYCHYPLHPKELLIPTYRVSLKLGSIEDLFPNPPGSPRGRMERLQVLGLFYFPLNHNRANTAFAGIPAGGGPNPTPALLGAWDYFKTRVLNNADDATADQEIQTLLKEWVVEGGKLPDPAAEGATPASENFGKLRLPGGYTFVGPFGRNLNDDPAYPMNFGTNNTYAVETLYRRDNPILGKIPIVAVVERRNWGTGEWEPAPGAHVYIQLVPPYDLPAFDGTKPPAEQVNRPPIRESTVGPVAPPAGTNGPVATGMGPAALTNQEEQPTGARAPDPSDPQGPNCPSDRGGERGKGALNAGTDVAGVIFEIISRPGFNVEHPVTPPLAPRDMSHDPYSLAQNAAQAGEHLHAVKAQTNGKGEAGVIFMPSRCGGDRYRLRAYVGPDTITEEGRDGTGNSAVRCETGTMVVWRNMRISRYIRQAANNPAPALLNEVNGAPYNLTNANRYLQRVRVVDSAGVNHGLPTADFSANGTGSAPFEGPLLQWAKGFVEVTIDRAAQAALPETMTQAQWQAARQVALQDGQAGLAANSLNLNLPVLMYMEPGSPITMANAVVNLPMRTPEAYNAHPSVTAAQQINVNQLMPGPTGALPALRRRIESLVGIYMLSGFLRGLNNNGFEPGLTAVQGAFGNTWQVISRLDRHSGIALNYRGCFIWLGASVYPTAIQPPITSGMTYDYTSNTCHELGHCNFRRHGPGFRAGGGPPGGATVARHDVQTNNESICVMSYQDCEGQFCAKCLFAFRGWNEMTL